MLERLAMRRSSHLPRRRKQRGTRLTGLMLALMIGWSSRAVFAAAPSVSASNPSTKPSATAAPATPYHDGRRYIVSRFTLSYAISDRQLPPASDLLNLTIELGSVKDGFVAPNSLEDQWLVLAHTPGKSPSRPTTRLRLADIKGPQAFYTSAIWAIDEQIRRELTRRNKILAVYVQPDPTQIQGAEDKRKAGDTALNIVVDVGHVQSIRTVSSGGRVPEAQRVNNPVDKWIREDSPVQPAPAPAGKTSLLRGDLLDDYIDFLNRHPGRHVDSAISSSTVREPGAVNLDYLVKEIKPWTVYAQVSNTGTQQTNEWRERFGFIDNQLTNHDDILSVDYSTAGFVDSHDLVGSYDFPISPSRRVRARVYGNYDQFTASDVGFANESFSGKQYDGGGELALNFFQHRNLFLDFVAGARYEHVNVTNKTKTVNTVGDADFAIPYAGVRLEQTSDINTLLADVTVLGRMTNASDTQLSNLGRLNTNSTAFLVQAVGSDSFFLEPLIQREKFNAATSSLAHEIFLSMRAQYAFDYRVIPAAEEVAGGLYSVRGYPESISAGDTVIVGTAEYRFHLPRALAPSNTLVKPGEQAPPPSNFLGQPFNFRPPQYFGRPDWDLILRGFIDAGQTINDRRQSFEHNDTLVGTGVGIEVDFRQYISARLDWGVALNGIPNETSAGDNRVSFVFTVTY